MTLSFKMAYCYHSKQNITLIILNLLNIAGMYQRTLIQSKKITSVTCHPVTIYEKFEVKHILTHFALCV